MDKSEFIQLISELVLQGELCSCTDEELCEIYETIVGGEATFEDGLFWTD